MDGGAGEVLELPSMKTAAIVAMIAATNMQKQENRRGYLVAISQFGSLV
jgi:hypothetical protein